MVSGPFNELRFPASNKFIGPPGPPGEPFRVEATGPKTDRPAFVAGVSPLSYLADDTGELSVKRATEWGPWIQFRGRAGKSAYEVWVSLPENAGKTEAEFFVAIAGEKGDRGDLGPSAFEVWLAQPGNEGSSEAEFFEYLRGPSGIEGASVYDIWIAAGNQGTETDFLADMRGNVGPSFFEWWSSLPENAGKTQADLMEELRGPSGTDGAGDTGLSAYEEWESQPGGANAGKTFAEFMAFLSGPPGTDGLSYQPDASGTLAERSAYDAYSPPFVYLVLDETAPEHDQLCYRLETPGGWSGFYPRAVPGPPGTEGLSAYEVWAQVPGNEGLSEEEFFASLEGPPGQPGPPGKTLYSGIGAPSAVLGAAGDHYLEKDASGAAVAFYGPKNSGGWGAAFPLKPPVQTKLAYLTFGGPSAGIGPRTDLTDFHSRSVFRLPVGVKRFRVKFRNYEIRDETAYTGTINITNGYMGEQAPDANGGRTGSFTAAPTQIFGAATVSGGAEWVSAWVDAATFNIQAHKDYVLSVGYTCSAGQQIAQASNKVYVGSTSANASAVTNPMSAMTQQPFAVMLEYEFAGSQPVVMAIGDSITEGTGSRLGQRHNWLTQYGLSSGAVPIVSGSGGSQAQNWAIDGYKYDRFDHANPLWALDACFILLGRNDLSAARTDAQITANLQTIINRVRTRYKPKRIYLCTVLPTNSAGWSSTQESYRRATNNWMRTLPAGVVSMIDFDKAMEQHVPVGLSLASVTGKGDWNSGANYVVDDLVWYRHNYWRATAANTNAPPTNNPDKWQTVISLAANYDSGDGIHPNEAGYARMVSAMPPIG